jgi:hypothetical protein
MLFGLRTPSRLPSRPLFSHVEGMNCIGPTARSHVLSPSRDPPSVSAMAAKSLLPSSCGPRMDGRVSPLPRMTELRAWCDSTCPIAASSGQVMPQLGSTRRAVRAACR